jgi:hypothetical protein
MLSNMGKRALLVGINYAGTTSELRGCENDVLHVKQYLLKRGYLDANIKVITEKTTLKPNRATILRELLELIISGDSELFFQYSGHGSHVDDRNGDEADGQDECLVPLDYQTNGMILDDHLRGLVTLVPPSTKLTIILDSCHSGTCMDLAYNLWERRGSYSMVKDSKYTPTDGNVCMISGSQDVQTSADAFEEGQYQGAMTWSLLKALEASPKVPTWGTLIKQMRGILKTNGYDQVPNFSSGKNILLDSTSYF